MTSIDGLYRRVETFSNRVYARLLSAYEYAMQHDWLAAILITAVVVFIGVFLGYANNKIVPVNTNPVAHYSGQQLTRLDYLSNWDGADYLHIVAHGYDNVGLTNFFPLYPTLVRIFSNLTSLPPILIALLISWLSFMGASYFYIKVIKQLFGTRSTKESVRALLLFVLFPTAIFMMMTYTEALTAFATVAAIHYALQWRYILAGLFGAVGTANHITGVFALLLVGMILLEREKGLKNWWQALVAMAIGSTGLLAFMIYLQLKFHNLFGFITAQKQHGWLKHTVNNPAADFGWLNFTMATLVVLAAIYWWPKRKSLAIYSLLFLAIPIAGGQFGGFNRYVLADYAIPLMGWGLLRNHKLGYPLMLCGSLVLWTYFLLQYCGGYVGG